MEYIRSYDAKPEPREGGEWFFVFDLDDSDLLDIDETDPDRAVELGLARGRYWIWLPYGSIARDKQE